MESPDLDSAGAESCRPWSLPQADLRYRLDILENLDFQLTEEDKFKANKDKSFPAAVDISTSSRNQDNAHPSIALTRSSTLNHHLTKSQPSIRSLLTFSNDTGNHSIHSLLVASDPAALGSYPARPSAMPFASPRKQACKEMQPGDPDIPRTLLRSDYVQPKLLSFQLAKLLTGNPEPSLTQEPDLFHIDDELDESVEDFKGRLTNILGQMMYVSGETAEPSVETTSIIEDVVRQQVIELVSPRVPNLYQHMLMFKQLRNCTELASRRGSRSISKIGRAHV